MRNKVELLKNNIIFVQKVGDQTEESMRDLFEKISKLAADLRAQNKSVLVLSDARKEGKMNINARKLAIKIGGKLDYDKSASYGSSAYLHSLRELMARATDLEEKVTSFKTRKEAETWLLQ